MKKIKCEMCGSTELMKQDGFFQCENCGCKYSLEEAKKLMVEIEGAIKIDTSEELANLYMLARRAKDSSNIGEALKYYNLVLVKDPTSWEAAFYALIFQSLQCKVAELATACSTIRQGMPSIINLVKNNILNLEEQKIIFNEIATKIDWIADIFGGNAKSYIKNADNQRAVFVAAGNVAYCFALDLRNAFPNGEHISSEMIGMKQGVNLQCFRIRNFPTDNNQKEREIYFNWAQAVKRYDPSYVIPELPPIGNI